MRLKGVRTERGGGSVRRVGETEGADNAHLPELRFEYEERYADFVRDNDDVLVAVLLTAAMLAGEELSTAMPVSAKVVCELSNLKALGRLESCMPQIIPENPVFPVDFVLETQ